MGYVRDILKGPMSFLLDWKKKQYHRLQFSQKYRITIRIDLARITSHLTICVPLFFHPNVADGQTLWIAWTAAVISKKKTRIVVGGDMKADANRNYSVESQFGC